MGFYRILEDPPPLVLVGSASGFQLWELVWGPLKSSVLNMLGSPSHLSGPLSMHRPRPFSFLGHKRRPFRTQSGLGRGPGLTGHRQFSLILLMCKGRERKNLSILIGLPYFIVKEKPMWTVKSTLSHDSANLDFQIFSVFGLCELGAWNRWPVPPSNVVRCPI